MTRENYDATLEAVYAAAGQTSVMDKVLQVFDCGILTIIARLQPDGAIDVKAEVHQRGGTFSL